MLVIASPLVGLKTLASACYTMLTRHREVFLGYPWGLVSLWCIVGEDEIVWVGAPVPWAEGWFDKALMDDLSAHGDNEIAVGMVRDDYTTT